MPSAQFETLKQSFGDAGLPGELVTELLNEYEENKRRYFLDDYRPAAINGGRFCEAVTRILQFRATGAYVPLADKIEVEKELNRLDNYGQRLGDGLRLHVVRAVRLIYGIRNSRDIGHLKDGIDPSLQDATLVVSGLDWILAELVRVAHGVTAADAQELIAGIVTKEVPLIEVFDGRPVVLGDLSHKDHVLVTLYWAGVGTVPRASLRRWLPDRLVRNLGRVLKAAEQEHLVHLDGDSIYLTRPGIKYVENAKLLTPR